MTNAGCAKHLQDVMKRFNANICNIERTISYSREARRLASSIRSNCNYLQSFRKPDIRSLTLEQYCIQYYSDVIFMYNKLAENFAKKIESLVLMIEKIQNDELDLSEEESEEDEEEREERQKMQAEQLQRPSFNEKLTQEENEFYDMLSRHLAERRLVFLGEREHPIFDATFRESPTSDNYKTPGPGAASRLSRGSEGYKTPPAASPDDAPPTPDLATDDTYDNTMDNDPNYETADEIYDSPSMEDTTDSPRRSSDNTRYASAMSNEDTAYASAVNDSTRYASASSISPDDEKYHSAMSNVDKSSYEAMFPKSLPQTSTPLTAGKAQSPMTPRTQPGVNLFDSPGATPRTAPPSRRFSTPGAQERLDRSLLNVDRAGFKRDKEKTAELRRQIYASTKHLSDSRDLEVLQRFAQLLETPRTPATPVSPKIRTRAGGVSDEQAGPPRTSVEIQEALNQQLLNTNMGEFQRRKHQSTTGELRRNLLSAARENRDSRDIDMLERFARLLEIPGGGSVADGSPAKENSKVINTGVKDTGAGVASAAVRNSKAGNARVGSSVVQNTGARGSRQSYSAQGKGQCPNVACKNKYTPNAPMLPPCGVPVKGAPAPDTTTNQGDLVDNVLLPLIILNPLDIEHITGQNIYSLESQALPSPPSETSLDILIEVTSFTSERDANNTKNRKQ